jgi:predicted ester cyclase
LKYDHELKVPDLRYELEELVSEPGVVIAVWEASGTPKNGTQELHVRGMSRHRIQSGRIVESLMTFNPLGVLPKLGA